LRGGWDVDDVERNRPILQTLLTMCATSGNAKAVALLIQHGADISKGVLRDIVEESVNCPQKTDKLLEVYRTIVDNAVTWKCLEDNRRTWTKGSDKYKECLYETMYFLITEPVEEGEDDVLERAIKLGASEMFQEIVNTEDVFCTRSLDESCAFFNITNFSLASRDIEEPGNAKTPYLHTLLINYDRWADTKIFNTPPIAELTERCIRVTNVFTFVIGLLQLKFMIMLSYFYMPDTCILNPNSSNASLTKNDCLWNQSKAESVSWFRFPFLAWTCLFFITSFVPYSVLFLIIKTQNSSNWYIKAMKLFMVHLWQKASHFAFFITVFVWLFYQHDPKKISMVFLFGWICALRLLSSISKEFSIFTALLDDVLSIDILQSFLPFFGFTVVAFSLSLHVLRVELLPQEQHYAFSLTAYDVFAASFGMGEEMFKNAREETSSTLSVFAVVFMTYMFLTAVILLNVLIAMISNRYKVAKRRAENNWRYQTLRRWTWFESFVARFCSAGLWSNIRKLGYQFGDIKPEILDTPEGSLRCYFIKVDLKKKIAASREKFDTIGLCEQ